MKTIVISPGHYDAYPGVVKNGYTEYNEVLKIVEILKSKFPVDYEVHVVNGKLLEKVNSINIIAPDIAIEVHLGNTNNSKVDGSRAFYMQYNNESKRLADILLEACIQGLNTEDRKSWLGWYKKISPSMVENGKAPEGWKAKIDLFLSKISCPTAFIEPFYISSTSDCKKFIVANRYDDIANSIRDGIIKYFNTIEQEST
jgi:N-acetylmuramoyl-L-alanine amidase